MQAVLAVSTTGAADDKPDPATATSPADDAFRHGEVALAKGLKMAV